MSVAEDMIEQVPELGSPPAVLAQLQKVVNDPNTSANDIAKVITTDSSLSARLLRIANSPIYGFPSKIDSVTTAVTVIGTRQINDLALATVVMDHFDGVESSALNMLEFWAHSLGVGVGAMHIAQTRRETNPERYLLFGVLHDIGRLVMALAESEQTGTAIKQAQIDQTSLNSVEKNVFGVCHGEVGMTLCQKWALPEQIGQVVASHHQPGNGKEAGTVLLADACVHGLGLGNNGESRVPSLPDSLWDTLAVDSAQLRTIVHQVKERYDFMASVLAVGDGNENAEKEAG